MKHFIEYKINNKITKKEFKDIIELKMFKRTLPKETEIIDMGSFIDFNKDDTDSWVELLMGEVGDNEEQNK